MCLLLLVAQAYLTLYFNNSLLMMCFFQRETMALYKPVPGGLVCAREFRDSVLPPLKSCIQSIECILDIVHCQTNHRGLQRQYYNIRAAIVDAKDQAFAAESAAASIIDEMNEYYERLIIQQSTMRSQIHSKTAELNDKRRYLGAERAALISSERQMVSTSSDVEKSRQQLSALNTRMLKAEEKKLRGIGVMVLGILFPPALLGGEFCVKY